MVAALDLAKAAAILGEVPVGAVILQKGEIIATAHNLVEKEGKACNHAEYLAAMQALAYRGSRYLDGCEIYITLEPCYFCASLLCLLRVDKIIYAAEDVKMGAVDNNFRIPYNTSHKPQIISGIMASESEELLKAFFKKLR